MRLEIGDRVKTNYGTHLYQIFHITRDCTCPSYLAALNLKNPPKSAKHIHIVVREVMPNGSLDKWKSYLNGYNGETLRSVWDDDMLILCPTAGHVQQTLF